MSLHMSYNWQDYKAGQCAGFTDKERIEILESECVRMQERMDALITDVKSVYVLNDTPSNVNLREEIMVHLNRMVACKSLKLLPAIVAEAYHHFDNNNEWLDQTVMIQAVIAYYE